MPIFEYTCPACNIDHEELLPFKQDFPCPHCGMPEILMQAKISNISVHFKGDGWASEGYTKAKLNTRSINERIK